MAMIDKEYEIELETFFDKIFESKQEKMREAYLKMIPQKAPKVEKKIYDRKKLLKEFKETLKKVFG